MGKAQVLTLIVLPAVSATFVSAQSGAVAAGAYSGDVAHADDVGPLAVPAAILAPGIAKVGLKATGVVAGYVASRLLSRGGGDNLIVPVLPESALD